MAANISTADVLVDTSVWIDFFRNPSLPTSRALAILLDDDRVCIAGPVLTELHHGCRTSKEWRHLKNLLEPLPRILVDDDLWDRVGELAYAMARKGHTLFIVDGLIACLAMQHKLFVFSLDKHFVQIAKYSELKLYQPL